MTEHDVEPSRPEPSRPDAAVRSGGGPILWLATGLGVGFLPKSPGTFGALLGVPLAVAIGQITSLAGQAALILALSALGVWICTRVARDWGVEDPQFVVWDELATVPVVFFGLSADQMSRPDILLAGFLLHRLFDITKPPPARQAERLPEGWGIMADDWVAAVMGCGVLHGLMYAGLFG